MYAGVNVKKKIKKKKKDSTAEKTKKRPKEKTEQRKDKQKKELEFGDDASNIRIGSYQMLEPIGKGGFGVVYRGLNVISGATVAVKRVGLHGIPKEELEGIETEIRLLKNLDHPNIVKYVDAIRSDDYLNIVLEFVENGALSNLLGKLLKHGHVEESLVAVYTTQILEGLKYLHEQGVVHRDIKGANILTTKEGVVKLADFGVATKLNESRKSESVVGTPYWMAPEIIEMTGQQSSACDIWSVGCTVVELLTGKPPYFELQQMPALFRIVQDEHPPLPDNISPALEDFLMQCFQKDPLRRVSAAELLRHPWLRTVSDRTDEIKQKSQEDSLRKGRTVSFSTEQEEKKKLPQSRSKLNYDENLPLNKRRQTVVDANGHATPMSKSSSVLSQQIAAAQVQASDLEVDEEEDPFADMDEDDDEVEAAPVKSNAEVPAEKINIAGSAKIKKSWVEDEGEDDFGDIGDDAEVDLTAAEEKRVKTRGDRSSTPQNVTEENEDEDVFADLEFEATDARFDQDVALRKQFLRVLTQLSPKEDEQQNLATCQKLTEMLKENPDAVSRLMSSHGVIPVMEMLEVPQPAVTLAVLKLVNLVIGHDQKFQSSMSLVGLVPAIIKFSDAFPSAIRIEAAHFVRQFCYANDFTRKMFVACGGLPVLVRYLEEPYGTSKTLVFNAVDCIRHVFDITTNPKNDFCRLFCKYKLPAPLTQTLFTLNTDKEHPDAAEYTLKVANIIHLFSQGDSVVKTSFAHPHVVKYLLSSLNTLSHDVLSLILKSIRNISMDSNTLDLLEAAGAVASLVPFLNSPHHDIQNQVLLSMYYLSTIKASRQEQAARAGVIPHLQRFIRQNHPLKQFALPIIFQLAKTSSRTRLELKKYSGVSFFLDLLEETYWKAHALDAIAFWLSEDPRRVEFILISSTNINKLVTVLKGTKSPLQFEKILTPFEKMLQASQAVNRALGRSVAFVDELVSRLTVHQDSNAIRISLLKLLTLLYDSHQNPEEFVARHNLIPVLQNLSKDKSAVMVAPLATSLYHQITNTADAAASVSEESDGKASQP